MASDDRRQEAPPPFHRTDSKMGQQDATTLASTQDSDEKESEKDASHYLRGWRFFFMALGVYLGTFLVNLEISIVSTSLVSIADDLGSFSQSSWVITVYLLTYTSAMIIVAKLSDLFGRKTMLLLSMFIFTAFSGGCAAAQNMTQLIVCRALQGLGGCGVYSIVMVIIFEMVPPSKYSLHYTIMVVLYGFSMSLGPIAGGIINDRSSWIWVFLLNIPSGIVCIVLVALSMPNGFPNHRKYYKSKSSASSLISRIDFVGALLMFAAMTMHITGLEEAANLQPWTSPSVLVPLCLSGVVWISFVVSQYYVTKPKRQQEAVFPWRFFQNRVAIGLVINAFLSGAISTSCMILIPIRSQAAVRLSAVDAGVHLLPFTLTMELGAMVVALCIKNRRLPPVYLGLLAAVMQVVGVVLLSMGSPDDPGYDAMYGIETVVGLGVGAAIAVTTLMMPYATDKRDLSVGTASIIQFRFMGGATALSIVTAVGNTWLREAMLEVLSPEETALALRRPDTVNSLPDAARDAVCAMFVQCFNLQTRILIGFAATQIPVYLLAWKRDQIRVK